MMFAPATGAAIGADIVIRTTVITFAHHNTATTTPPSSLSAFILLAFDRRTDFFGAVAAT